MNSYLLNNIDDEKKVLLYQEKTGYTFTPKSMSKSIKKITVIDTNMISNILETKVIKSYNRLLKIIYDLISSDDTASGDVLVTYTEIQRIEQYLLSIKDKISKEFFDKYMKKLYVLELELKKVHVMELEEEITEERGKSR